MSEIVQGLTAHPAPKKRPHKPSSTGLPRSLPWESPMTRVWAGTKILCLATLSTVLLVRPSWVSVVVVGLALLVGSVFARVTWSCLPRFPMWLWAGLIGGIVGATLSGATWLFIRLCIVALWLVWGSTLLVWCTELEKLTPALSVLLRPLRWMGLPVDEWCTTMVLALRGFPSLMDQMWGVLDATKLRSANGANMGFTEILRMTIDVTSATLSASSRRAADTGRAMTLRGGVPPVPVETERPGVRDVICLAITVLTVALTFIFGDENLEILRNWLSGLLVNLPWG